MRIFFKHASRIISGAVEIHRPREIRIFKIDNWFDHKWLAFSGKGIGAIGIWNTQEFLTLPPFVQNRLVDQGQYVRDESSGRYAFIGAGTNIHYRGWSARNLQRRVTRIVPDTALFWYSGNSATTGRGSLMGYLPLDQDVCGDRTSSAPHISAGRSSSRSIASIGPGSWDSDAKPAGRSLGVVISRRTRSVCSREHPSDR